MKLLAFISFFLNLFTGVDGKECHQTVDLCYAQVTNRIGHLSLTFLN